MKRNRAVVLGFTSVEDLSLIRSSDETSAHHRTLGMFLGEFETDGFIHLSYPNQVVRVANTIYTHEPNLVLLVIDRARVLGEIRDEDLNDLGEEYLHLYAALYLDAVTEILEFPVQPDGSFVLPVEIFSHAQRKTLVLEDFAQ
jgi:uncharacterized protein (DUF952 family)